MELSPICKKEYPALRALYRSAFPAAERMPLSRFFALQKKGQAEILVLRTGGAFAGLMIVNGGWISMPKTAFSPATCRYGCAAWHWMCSRPAGRHWILPPIKGFIARSLAVWRPFLCKSANKTPPGQILLVFWPGVV